MKRIHEHTHITARIVYEGKNSLIVEKLRLIRDTLEDAAKHLEQFAVDNNESVELRITNNSSYSFVDDTNPF